MLIADNSASYDHDHDGATVCPKDNMQAAGANLTLCSTHVGHKFDCLASTLEMLFKDVETRQVIIHGGFPFNVPFVPLLLSLVLSRL